MDSLAPYSGASLIALAGLLGLIVGSFLNVVIHRLPKMMETSWRRECAELSDEPIAAPERFDLLWPNSHCPHCRHAIRTWENIPVVSYVFLRGRCSSCKAPISVRYPVVELFAGFASAAVIAHFGPTLAGAGALLLLWALIALTGIDFDTQLLPDAITLPLIWAGLLLNIGNTYVDLRSAVVGAVLGYLTLWSVYWGFKLFTGKEGMGYGDFKLLSAIGAWLGFQMLPLVILLSSVVGACVGIALMATRRHGRDVPIPFGPYLAAAGMIALLWGKPLTAMYFGLLQI